MRHDSPRSVRTPFGLPLLGLLIALVASSCGNNIGRLFDPVIGTPPGESGSAIQPVPDGGSVREGRPTPTDAFPTGNGVAPSTPIVVVFDESLAPATVLPETTSPLGGVGSVFLRDSITMTPVPGFVDLLMGDTVVVLRPSMDLQPVEYEIVVAETVTDVDGIPTATSEQVVGFLTPDLDTTASPDGEIVATLPADNAGDVVRTSDVYVFFDRPADAGTIDAANFSVDTASGTIPGTVLPAFTDPLGAEDTRVALFDATGNLAGETRHEIRLNSGGITFDGGNGTLNTGGATAFSVFDTVLEAPPTSFEFVNAPMGFPLALNGTNLGSVMVEIGIDDSVQAGAIVEARIYGGDPSTAMATEDLTFLEAAVEVATPGPGTVMVDFGTQLGVAGATALEEGSLTLQAQVVRGTRTSGFASAAGDPILDTIAPTIDEFLPSIGTVGTDLVTDQRSLLAFGRANEELGAGDLVVDTTMVSLFGSESDGRFAFAPIDLGLRTTPVMFTLNVTDRAGNVAPAITGMVHPRGVVGGGAVTGTLTVEAYDAATLAVLPGATVILDPDGDTRRTMMTDANGVAEFTGLTTTAHTITIVADGYDLVTLVDTRASFVSMPVRGTAAASRASSLSLGALELPDGVSITTLGTGLRLGSNLFADPEQQAATVSLADPSGLANLTVRSGRPFSNSVLTGTFPATARPTFTSFACEICGIDGMTPSVGAAPTPPGQTATSGFQLLTSAGQTANLLFPSVADFAAANLGTIDGLPTVEVVTSYGGLPGVTLTGVGFATAGATSTQFTIDAGYFTPSFLAPTELLPQLFLLSIAATDTDGAFARVRQSIATPTSGLAAPTIDPLALPTATSVGAAGAVPTVDLVDGGAIEVVFAATPLFEIHATDPAGRGWTVFRQDRTPAGGTATIAFPDLTGTGAAGLSAGDWSLSPSITTFVGASPDLFAFEDRFRIELARSRAQSLTVTVN